MPIGIPLYVTAQVWLSILGDWIGFAQPERPVITCDQGSFDGHLILVLSDEQLAVIEQRRGSGDLQLRIGLDLVLGYDPGPIVATADQTQLYPKDPWPTVHTDEEVWVQSGPWQRLLEQSFAGMSLAIVVPVPIGRDSPSVRAGATQGRDSKVNTGECADAVVSARKAIGALGADWATKRSIVADTTPQIRSYSQRRTLLRHALWSLASTAARPEPPHDVDTSDGHFCAMDHGGRELVNSV